MNYKFIILVTAFLFGIFFMSANFDILAQGANGEYQEGLTTEQQLDQRESRFERLGNFLSESVVTISALILFIIFFGVAAYLALGVILLVFFGGVGGK